MEELYHTFRHSLNTMGEAGRLWARGREGTQHQDIFWRRRSCSHEICANSAQDWAPEHFVTHVGVSSSVRPHPFLKDNWHIKMSGEEGSFLQWRHHWQTPSLYNRPMLRMELTKLTGPHIIKEPWKRADLRRTGRGPLKMTEIHCRGAWETTQRL